MRVPGQHLLYENEFYSEVHFHANQTHFYLMNGFRTWTRFETEAKGNLKLGILHPYSSVFRQTKKFKI